jgi:uncharacterized membrane protein
MLGKGSNHRAIPPALKKKNPTTSNVKIALVLSLGIRAYFDDFLVYLVLQFLSLFLNSKPSLRY